MLFNAHTYHSIQQYNNTADPLRIVGAILPDSALTGTIDWTALHTRASIDAFVSQLPQNYEQLGHGLIDHHDLDLRSHDIYEGSNGYAFTHQTPELRRLVAEACGIRSSEQIERITHNFIESGVDINVLRNDSAVEAQLSKAITQADLGDIAKLLARYFELDETQTRTHLNDYASLITSYDLTDIEGWVALWGDLTAILLNHLADEQTLRKALLLAAELTAEDYMRMLSS